MKHSLKTLSTAILLIVMLFTSVCTAYAITGYYPSSGIMSGYCENATRSSICTFNSLPAGVMKINYVLDSNSTMELRFYRNSSLSGSYAKATLYDTSSESDGTLQTTVVLPYSGTYYVVLFPSNSGATTFTYAYNLFRD